MDVTQEILNNHLTYGASDNTAPGGLAAAKSLNYAKGASIQKPVLENVTVVPRRPKYADTVAWFDVRLYTKAREEHPYDEMYLPPTDYFYIGFHARNTRRLPYNVECLIGTGYKPKSEVDPRLIAKVN